MMEVKREEIKQRWREQERKMDKHMLDIYHHTHTNRHTHTPDKLFLKKNE